jgi:hypothetical protein
MFRKRPILHYALRLVLLAFVIVCAFQVGVVGTKMIFRLQHPANNPPAAMNPVQQLASIFTPEVMHWSPLIYAWASAYNVDPNLIATVIQIESCGDPNVVSGSGAQGLFQVMPDHFAKPMARIRLKYSPTVGAAWNTWRKHYRSRQAIQGWRWQVTTVALT